MKKIFSSLAVAVFAISAVMIMSIGTASAAWTTPAAEPGDTWAIQDANSDDVTLTADPEYTFTGTVPQDSIITITLGGGAKFQEAPITANITFTDTSGAPTPTVSVIGAPAAGCTSFQILVSDADIANTDKLAISDSGTLGLDLSGVTSPGVVTMSIKAENQAGNFTWLSADSVDLVEAVNIFSAETTTASATTKIDVANSKMKLVKAGVDGTDVKTASATYKITRSTVTLPGSNIAIGKLLFTIEGDMSAVKSITDTTTGVIKGSDSTGDQTNGTVDEFLIDKANNIAYASNTGTLAAAAALTLAPQIEFDGTTVIPAGSYTVKATLIKDASFSAYDGLSAFTFADLSYNGTVVYPGIIIGSGYGYQGGFRIANRGTNDANIYFQVQNYGGDMTEQFQYPDPLGAGKTVYISADDVLTACGLTTTSSANGIITVEGQNIDISQISSNPSGGYTIVPLTKSNNQAY